MGLFFSGFPARKKPSPFGDGRRLTADENYFS